MKHIAVIGTGTIGLMLGGFLAKGGHDVTLVSQFRRETASQLAERGIHVTFDAEDWTVPVRAVYYADLPTEEQFDILFVTGKSNDTADAMQKMTKHLKEDGFVSSLQNGINDDVIAEFVGTERVIPCVCFAGGQVPEPCHVVTHDGYFIIGELDGSDTLRLRELEQILSCAKRVEVTERIMAARWRKLSEVCLTVPAATVSGLPLFSGSDHPLVQRLFGKLAVEVMAVQRACGNVPEPIMHLDEAEWAALAAGPDPQVEAKFLNANRMPSPPPADPDAPRLAPADAYTSDIRKGRPLEVFYTNGYIAAQGEKHGIDVSVNKALLDAISAIESGDKVAGIALLEELVNT